MFLVHRSVQVRSCTPTFLYIRFNYYVCDIYKYIIYFYATCSIIPWYFKMRCMYISYRCSKNFQAIDSLKIFLLLISLNRIAKCNPYHSEKLFYILLLCEWNRRASIEHSPNVFVSLWYPVADAHGHITRVCVFTDVWQCPNIDDRRSNEGDPSSRLRPPIRIRMRREIQISESKSSSATNESTVHRLKW